MRTGQLAREAGVNVEALRYYERRGILSKPKRTPSSGYREYPGSRSKKWTASRRRRSASRRSTPSSSTTRRASGRMRGDGEVTQREHALTMRSEVFGAAGAAEVDRLPVDLLSRAGLLHLERDSTHQTIGALTGLGARLHGNVGRPADMTDASPTFAAFETFVDGFPRLDVWRHRSDVVMLRRSAAIAAGNRHGHEKDVMGSHLRPRTTTVRPVPSTGSRRIIFELRNMPGRRYFDLRYGLRGARSSFERNFSSVTSAAAIASRNTRAFVESWRPDGTSA
jgi:hypothetical protein